MCLAGIDARDYHPKPTQGMACSREMCKEVPNAFSLADNIQNTT